MAYTSYSIYFVVYLNAEHVDNIMSNTLADTLSDTESFDEFEEVLVQLTSIQEIQEDALLRLARLQQSLTRNISVDHNWDEVLDELHAVALRSIRETGQNPFGSAVHQMIKKLK